MTEKQFPFDAAFKQKVLAIILRDKSFVAHNRHILSHRYFDNPAYVTLCETILDFYDKYQVTPTIDSLYQKLGEHSDFALFKTILEKLEVVDLKDADYVKDEVRNFCKQQAFRIALYQAEALLKEKEYDKILSLFEKAALTGEDNLLDGFTLSDSVDRVKEHLSEDHLVTAKIPTLIMGMDRILRGGVWPVELHVVFAPTKRGKSILLNNLAFACALKGKKATYISLEMNDVQVATRTHMRLSGLNDTDLLQFERKWMRSFRRLLSTGGDIYYKRFPTGRLSLTELERFLDKLWKVERFSTDLLIVDYLDLMKKDREYDDTWKGQGRLAEGLRGIAGEMSIPCWSATQGGKSSGNKEQLEEDDVKGDSIKNDTIDSLWSLVQNDADRRGKPPRGKLKCNLLREGAGMGDVIPIQFDKTRMLITDLKEEI